MQAISEAESDVRIYLLAPKIEGAPNLVADSAVAKCPMKMNFEGAPSHALSHGWNLYQYVRSNLGIERLDKQSRTILQNADVIHLNSLSLIHFPSMAGPQDLRAKYVCHIREIARTDRLRPRSQELARIDGLVFIDSFTEAALRRALPESHSLPRLTLPNLISPVSVGDTPLAESIRTWASGHPVVGVAGRIQEVKGITFLLDLFMRPELRDVGLVIAGKSSGRRLNLGARRESNRLHAAIRSRPHQVRYLGEVENLSESGFYNAINALVRADPFAAVGRTTLEALVNSTPVVMPGSLQDYEGEEQLQPFRDLISFAVPRNVGSYLDGIRKAIATSVRKEKAHLLPDQYSEDIRIHGQVLLDFYRSLMAKP